MLPEGKGSENPAIALVQYSIGSGGEGAGVGNTPRRNMLQRTEISAKPNWPLGFPYQVLIKAV